MARTGLAIRNATTYLSLSITPYKFSSSVPTRFNATELLSYDMDGRGEQ